MVETDLSDPFCHQYLPSGSLPIPFEIGLIFRIQPASIIMAKATFQWLVSRTKKIAIRIFLKRCICSARIDWLHKSLHIH
jgi:hypothetical protein